MTKKDYELIASHIARLLSYMPPSLGTDSDRSFVAQMARNLASDLAAENGAFNRHTFLKACGLLDSEE